jgi:hypothetical protein
MAFLSFGPVTKGTPAEVELDLAALLALVTDVDFDSADKLSKVLVAYVAPGSTQTKVLVFRVPAGYTGDASLKAKFKTSSKAKDEFQIDSVVLLDLDGGRYRMSRADIPDAAEMDISVGGGLPSVTVGSVDRGSFENSIDLLIENQYQTNVSTGQTFQVSDGLLGIRMFFSGGAETSLTAVINGTPVNVPKVSGRFLMTGIVLTGPTTIDFILA